MTKEPDFVSYDDGGGRFSGALGNARDYIPSKATLTRIWYCCLLVVGFIVALVVRNGAWGLMAKIPVISDGCEATGTNTCYGNAAVYRVSFSCAIFFAINLFFSSPLFCVGDALRLRIQHGFWWIKVPAFLVLLVIPFFIPNIFFVVWAWISIFLAAIFMVAQILIYIDFAYSWNESWVEKDEQKWYIAILVFTGIFVITGILFIIAEFVVFGSKPSCHLNRFFISMPFVFAVIYFPVSIKVEHGALLPSGLVFAYTAFSVWSGLSSYPYNSDPSQNCNILSSAESGERSKAALPTLIMGIIVTAFSLFRTTVSVSSRSSSQGFMNNGEEEDDERKENKLLFWAQIMFFLASFYLGMVITGWEVRGNESSEDLERVDEGYVAVGVKIAAMFLTVALYFWSLIAPYIFKNREF
eukprot:gb/GECH01003692.1/.p1 GENE.gb/GECH01003692.1/~~gb/GECH01003692.1/.p1  ORF type:complete len:412 (+),score=52.94 gb/GECH01003692.1/:1-1236(+)